MPPLSQWLAWFDAYMPYVFALAGFVGAVWHLFPQGTRDTFERRFPRFVGTIRLLYTLGPDLHGAWLTFRTQLVEGQPKRGAK